MASGSRKAAYFALYLIFFFDLAGMVIALSLFGPLIAGTEGHMVNPAMSTATRNLIVGLLTAAYPLTQFFGAPILGEMSDQRGRRPILLFSTLGSAVAFALCGLAINLKSLTWLFIGRLIGGITGGNTSVAQAGAIDITPPERRAKCISYFSVMAGLSWVIGPFLGGLLSDRQLVSWFNLGIPFWFTGLTFLLAFFLILFAFQESRPITQPGRTHVWLAFKNLLSVLKIPRLRHPFLSLALGLLGWAFFLFFFSPYLVERFHFNVRWVSGTYLYLAVWYMIGGFVAGHWLLHRWHASKVNIFPLIIQVVVVFCFLFFTRSYNLWWAVAIGALCQSILGSGEWTLLSEIAGPENQGKLFGSWNALGLALSGILAPAISGWLAGYWLVLPFLVSVIIMAISTIYYLIWYYRYRSLHPEDLVDGAPR